MSAKFLSYKHVPPGFEVIIGDKQICPRSPGGIWNLWWNVQLSDDPEAWDGEVKLINGMQSRLGKLTGDQRLIRAQMAEFCRESPLFPGSVDVLCGEIGEGRFDRPLRMGCEGRGLLDALGYNDPARADEQRKSIYDQYSGALRKWQAREPPETPTDSRIYGYLGATTESKRALVEDFLSELDTGEPSYASLKEMSEKECVNAFGKSFLDSSARPFHCFACPASRLEGRNYPDCMCCNAMVIDAGLLSTRESDETWSVYDEIRRFKE